MDVLEWTDRMANFTEIGNSTTQKLIDPDKWQDWAMNLVGDPDETGRDAPDPYGFNDWRKWADAFFLSQDLL
jgi:hypothetical protein